MDTQQIVLITGANTGLGLEIVRALSSSATAYHILVGCRNQSKGEHAIDTLKTEFPETVSTFELIQLDVESDESIERAIESITNRLGRIDILINNAGGSFDTALQEKQMRMREAWDRSWSLNVTSAQVLTTLSVPLLLKSSKPRLLFITSGTACLAETEKTDNPMLLRNNGSPSAGWPKEKQPLPIAAYRSAKTGLNMMMREWHRLLQNDGVKVWCVMPGFLATGFGNLGKEAMRQLGAMEPSKGGMTIRDVVEGKRDQEVGQALRPVGTQPW